MELGSSCGCGYGYGFFFADKAAADTYLELWYYPRIERV
jgi:hypothetical protein